DGVFHVAAWYKVGVTEPLADRVNVDGTRNVLKTMCSLEIPRGVYTSTVAVFSDTRGAMPDETYRYDGNHLSEYDRTKWIAHYRVALPKMDDGLPLTIVMPGLVYGPNDTSGMHSALVDLLRGRLPMTPARTAFCWGHVEDTARGHILAMEKGRPGETYIIAGPRQTFEYAFDLAASIAKVRPPIVHPGPRAMRAMAAMMSAAQHLTTLPPALTPEALRVLAGTTYLGSNAKAVREIGFTARPLEEGMAQALEHELRLLGRG
ncbi:MAG: NAD-dependent epimerase/dehydratase family protein, partial [Vicinamibacterales bacterium]